MFWECYKHKPRLESVGRGEGASPRGITFYKDKQIFCKKGHSAEKFFVWRVCGGLSAISFYMNNYGNESYFLREDRGWAEE